MGLTITVILSIWAIKWSAYYSCITSPLHTTVCRLQTRPSVWLISRIFSFLSSEHNTVISSKWNTTMISSLAKVNQTFFQFDMDHLTLISKSWKTHPEIFPEISVFRDVTETDFWKTHPVFFRNFNFRRISWTDFWKIHPSIFCEYLFSFS